MKILRGVAISVLMLLAQLAWGQANVNETLETATYWVDATTGSDSNPGTQQLPFKTIGAAVAIAEANNLAGVGSKVNVNPGTYRESVTLQTNGQDTTLPITIQAATAGTAILNGADIFSGWQPYSGNSSIYTTVWPYQFGFCSSDNGGAPYQEDITLRREMVIVNGAAMTQVQALGQMQPGTFYVDEVNAAIYVWPPSTTNMSTATVEVSTRGELLNVVGKSNVVLRGMTFKYSNSCRTDSAVDVTMSTNILLDGNFFYWNNGQGIGLNGDSYVTEQNSVANHNGSSGMGDYETLYGYFYNNTTKYNNWRGAQGAYYRWSIAGFHPFASHTSSISHLVSAYNEAYGIHWDTDNQNVTADSMYLYENLLAEGFIEKSEGPIAITNSYMCNGNPTTGPVTIGFELRNSTNVSFSGNTMSNDESAFQVLGTAGGLTVTNWQDGTLYNLVTSNISASNNTYVAGANGSVFYDASLGGTDWATFASTMSFDYNNWFDGADTTPFVVPVPASYSQLDLPGWQALTGQEQHSTAVQPSPGYDSACTVAPEGADFWLVIDPLSDQIDIPAGSPVSFAGTITALGGFNGTVNFTADGVQNIPGATSSWDTQVVNGSGTATLSIQTAPSTPTGVYPVTLIANSGDVTRTLTGSVLVNTTIAIDPMIANLGNVNMGLTSKQFQVTMNNFGTSAVTINSITATGDFSQTNTCGGSLGPASACAITLTFTPTAVGPRTGSLIFNTVDPGAPQTVPLLGVGVGVPVLTMSPATITFPDTDVHSVAGPLPLTLTNTGTASLHISSIAPGGMNPGDFGETNNCPPALAPGTSCTVSVTFSPLIVGARAATMTVSSDASSFPQAIVISGNGVTPSLTVTQQILNFGNDPIGVVSAPMQSTITNTGTGPLIIISIVLGGTNPGDFAEANNCPISPATLPAGGSCTFTVTFDPTILGSRAATVTITDNVLSGNLTLSLFGIGTTPAAVQLSATSISFPNTDVRSVSDPVPVRLTNTGTGTLTISSITLTGANQADFAETNDCGTAVPPGGSCTITVTFSPLIVGARNAVVTITDNAAPPNQAITLTGTGVTPGVTISLQSISFGNEPVGLTSAPIQSTITNTGTGPLIITSITLGGTNLLDFNQTNNCPILPATLAVNASCTFTVSFTPTAIGTRNATIVIVDNVLSGNQTLFLSGTGTTPAAVTLNPSALSFPSTDVNSSSTPSPVTLTNNGTGTLTITSILVGGNNAGDFSQTNNCGGSVPSGGSCTITVTFTPTATGTRSGKITVTDNANPPNQLVTLSGTAVAPIITVSPGSVSFPNTTDNTTSAPVPVTLTNTGTGPMLISSIVLGGANSTDFRQTNTCPISPASLAVNASCTINPTFTPTAMGLRSGTVTINSNVLAGPKVVNLTGTGISFTVKFSPTTWAFPSTLVGVPSTSKAITLTNQGSITLNISSINFTGTNAGDFSQTNTCGNAVAPLATCTINVTFKPLGTGSRSAALSVSDNGDGSPQAVGLTGTGVQPGASLSVTSLTYTTQQYNTASKSQTVVLTNNGTASLTITGITFTGANAGDFSQTSTCPLSPSTLAATKTCSILVTFTPKGMGARSASLSIADNAPNSPQTVALTGTGTFAKITPVSVAFSPVTVGRSSAGKVVTFTNVGNTALTMNSISITGTNSSDFTETTTCGTTVGAGASCTVTVTFKPTAVGTRNANLFFDDSDGAGPQTVPLTGTGI